MRWTSASRVNLTSLPGTAFRSACLELVGVDLGDVPDQVGGEGPVRIRPHGGPLHLHPWEVELALLEVRPNVRRNAGGDLHRCERGGTRIVDAFLDVLRSDTEDPREPSDDE